MPSYGVCDSLLSKDGEDDCPSRWKIFAKFADQVSLKIVVDVDASKKDDLGFIAGRYHALAANDPVLAEWLGYLIKHRGYDAFDKVKISGASSFEQAMCAAVSVRMYARGVITPEPEKYTKFKESTSIRFLDLGDAFQEMHDMNKGSIYVTGDGNVVAGGDIGEAYTRIEKGMDQGTVAALKEIESLIQAEGKESDRELYETLVKELSDKKPKKSVIGLCWKSLVDSLPAIAKIAAEAPKLLAAIG